MRLSRYGIMLEQLAPDHLEMVRLWRNQDFIRKNMHFSEILSRDDQERWFSELDLEKNLYWVIRTNKYPIGLIHIKDLEVESLTGEAGIFVGEPSYLEMPQPMLAILFMMEMAFYALGLKSLRAKIKSGNTVAINFNRKLGYELVPNQPEGFQYYKVDLANFETATAKLREQSSKMFGAETVVENIHDLNALNSSLFKGISRQDYFFKPNFI